MQLVHANVIMPTRNRCELASELRMYFSNQSIEILVARLDNVGLEIIPSLIELLDDAESDRANRFIFERDRFRFIVGRARLRQELSTRLDVRPEAIEFVYGPFGKPALSRRFEGSNLRFNVSHSEDIAVYAFSCDCEIGVDVEAVRIIHEADDIAAQFFSDYEKEAYLALDPCDKPLGFFNCWTRKEAFIKAIGNGLYHPLDSFDVSLAPREPAKILGIQGTPRDDCGWYMSSFLPAPGFVAAVAAVDCK